MIIQLELGKLSGLTSKVPRKCLTINQPVLSKYPRITLWCIPKAPRDYPPSFQRGPNYKSPKNYERNQTKCRKKETVMKKKNRYDYIETDPSLIRKKVLANVQPDI